MGEECCGQWKARWRLKEGQINKDAWSEGSQWHHHRVPWVGFTDRGEETTAGKRLQAKHSKGHAARQTLPEERGKQFQNVVM